MKQKWIKFNWKKRKKCKIKKKKLCSAFQDKATTNVKKDRMTKNVTMYIFFFPVFSFHRETSNIHRIANAWLPPYSKPLRGLLSLTSPSVFYHSVLFFFGINRWKMCDKLNFPSLVTPKKIKEKKGGKWIKWIIRNVDEKKKKHFCNYWIYVKSKIKAKNEANWRIKWELVYWRNRRW